MKEDAAFPRTVTTRGELRDVKRPACFSVTDRRVSKLRPSLSVSRAAGMSSRSGRQMHSDRLAEDEAQSAPSPASDGRSDQLQPPAKCPAGEGLTSNSNRRTWTEDEGPVSTPSNRPALRAKDQRQTPQRQQFPRGRPVGRANHPSGLTRAQGSRPQVSMVGNLGESQTVRQLLPHRKPGGKVSEDPPAKVFTKVNRQPGRSTPITSATVRASGRA